MGAVELIIDVVIPTFRPDGKLFRLLDLLAAQTVRPRTVRVINTGREGLDSLLAEESMTERQFLERYPFLALQHIRPGEFDHGGTRNAGFAACEGADFCLAMTQDAVPLDETLVERLVRPMLPDADPEGKLAVSYARQLPNKEASCEERLSRAFNYPDVSRTKSAEDLPELGVKTYFCSNVCAMYRMRTWQDLGGFPAHAIFNEDMIYAAKALKAGYEIRYAADACVIHSHSYTASQQFHRNFDLGVSQAQNPQVFSGISSEGEGTKYVRNVVSEMKRSHETGKIPGFLWRCAARLAGYRLGKGYRHLPKKMVRCFSSNRGYWRETDSMENDTVPGQQKD